MTGLKTIKPEAVTGAGDGIGLAEEDETASMAKTTSSKTGRNIAAVFNVDKVVDVEPLKRARAGRKLRQSVRFIELSFHHLRNLKPG